MLRCTETCPTETCFYLFYYVTVYILLTLKPGLGLGLQQLLTPIWPALLRVRVAAEGRLAGYLITPFTFLEARVLETLNLYPVTSAISGSLICQQPVGSCLAETPTLTAPEATDKRVWLTQTIFPPLVR